jgi:hypothetical protein
VLVVDLPLLAEIARNPLLDPSFRARSVFSVPFFRHFFCIFQKNELTKVLKTSFVKKRKCYTMWHMVTSLQGGGLCLGKKEVAQEEVTL